MRARKEIEADVEKAMFEGDIKDLDIRDLRRLDPIQRILIETLLDIRELLQTFPHLHKKEEKENE